MSIFSRAFDKLANRVRDDMIEDMVEDSRPYFYLSILPFGGPDQDPPPGALALPAEILEYAQQAGGLISFSSSLDRPEESEYLNGVLCTFHARSRMEAAGALLAFTSLTDDRLEMAVMQTAVSQVSSLEVTDDDKDAATQIYEFTKSEEGDLIIAFPTQSDEGELDFSGCFVTLSSPRRTDSEVARMVVKASGTIYAGNILPALMSALHRDIGSYGVLHPGANPGGVGGSVE